MIEGGEVTDVAHSGNCDNAKLTERYGSHEIVRGIYATMRSSYYPV
jgi:hypothetical protein